MVNKEMYKAIMLVFLLVTIFFLNVGLFLPYIVSSKISVILIAFIVLFDICLFISVILKIVDIILRVFENDK